MKVRCIDNAGLPTSLTINKIYEVIEENADSVFIKDDINLKYGYFKSRFEIVEEEKEEFTFYVDNTYKGWEILKMIDEKILNKGDGYKRLNNIYSLNKFTVGDGGYPSVDSLLRDKFVLMKKEYMTFLEAKKLGIPKHKDYEYGKQGNLLTIKEIKEFIKEMDKKVWTIEGEE